MQDLPLRNAPPQITLRPERYSASTLAAVGVAIWILILLGAICGQIWMLWVSHTPKLAPVLILGIGIAIAIVVMGLSVRRVIASVELDDEGIIFGTFRKYGIPYDQVVGIYYHHRKNADRYRIATTNGGGYEFLAPCSFTGNLRLQRDVALWLSIKKPDARLNFKIMSEARIDYEGVKFRKGLPFMFVFLFLFGALMFAMGAVAIFGDTYYEGRPTPAWFRSLTH